MYICIYVHCIYTSKYIYLQRGTHVSCKPPQHAYWSFRLPQSPHSFLRYSACQPLASAALLPSIFAVFAHLPYMYISIFVCSYLHMYIFIYLLTQAIIYCFVVGQYCLFVICLLLSAPILATQHLQIARQFYGCGRNIISGVLPVGLVVSSCERRRFLKQFTLMSCARFLLQTKLMYTKEFWGHMKLLFALNTSNGVKLISIFANEYILMSKLWIAKYYNIGLHLLLVRF